MCRRPIEILEMNCGSLLDRHSIGIHGSDGRGHPDALQFVSPLDPTKRYFCHQHAYQGSLRYESPCPTCRRPLVVVVGDTPGLSLVRPWFKQPSVGTWLLLPSNDSSAAVATSQSINGAHSTRFAFVSVLYGDSEQYVRDACVLGWSLRRTDTSCALVLMHTQDVPTKHLNALGKLWSLRLVRRIDGAETLFMPNSRFRGVFTKLHAWSLTEFERVILLDLDLLILRNIDELFELRAPAALWQQCSAQVHGEPVSAPSPWKGYHPTEPWGKAGCVNGGVVLLQPDWTTFEHMLKEVECVEHPEHIRTTSPEQDYFTRYFWHTPGWTHLGVEFNFQLHQAALWLPVRGNYSCARTTALFEDLRVIHFSAHPKPSQRSASQPIEEFVEEMLQKYEGWQLYVEKDPDVIERRNRRGRWARLELRDDGRLFESQRSVLDHHPGDSHGDEQLAEEVLVTEYAVKRLRMLASRAVWGWDEVWRSYLATFGQLEQACANNPLVASTDAPEIVGTCTFWDRAKGTGYIEPDGGGSRMFVHHSDINNKGGGRVHLAQGEHVLFRRGRDELLINLYKTSCLV